MVAGKTVCDDLMANRDQYPRTTLLVEAVVSALQREDSPHSHLHRILHVLELIYNARYTKGDSHLPVPFNVDNVKLFIQSSLHDIKVVENLSTIDNATGKTTRLWGCVLKDKHDATMLGGDLKTICLNADMIEAYERSPRLRAQDISGALTAGIFAHETMHAVHLRMFPFQDSESTPTLSIGLPGEDGARESGFALEELLFGGAMGTIWDGEKSGHKLFDSITNFTITKHGGTYNVPDAAAANLVQSLLKDKQFTIVPHEKQRLPNPKPPLSRGREMPQIPASPTVDIPAGHTVSRVGDSDQL
ncbi:hypothetical protein MKEN_01224900 [Mycena kentingensis (nom. inval.)]|nr:hypothetical protein MKEN_01224900 [Mycena kentingensis (nom. inval.)]